MSWKPLKRPAGKVNSRVSAPVTLAGTVGGGRVTPRLVLVTRPSLEDGMGWIAGGVRCNVMVGEGEHAGLLRIEAAADGDYAWYVPGGRRARIAVALFLPWPDGVKPTRQDTRPVQFDYSDGWLEITLPAYAQVLPGVAAAERARQAALAKLPGGKGRSLSAGTSSA